MVGVNVQTGEEVAVKLVCDISASSLMIYDWVLTYVSDDYIFPWTQPSFSADNSLCQFFWPVVSGLFGFSNIYQ